MANNTRLVYTAVNIANTVANSVDLAGSKCRPTPTTRATAVDPSQAATRDAARVEYAVVEGGRRCLLTRCPDGWGSIEECHLLPRDDRELDFLDHVLGYRPVDKHNLDSTSNMIFLSASLHTSFDKNVWCLLPPASVLQSVHTWVKAEMLKAAEGDSRVNYRDTDLPSKSDGCILAAGPAAANAKDESGASILIPMHFSRIVNDATNELSMWHYPFHQFPAIDCHAHPFSLIFNAGPKCTTWFGLWGSQDVIPLPIRDQVNAIVAIHSVLNNWRKQWDEQERQARRTRNSRHGSGPSGTTGRLGNGSESTTNTRNDPRRSLRHSDTGGSGKRKAPDGPEQDSPTSKKHRNSAPGKQADQLIDNISSKSYLQQLKLIHERKIPPLNANPGLDSEDEEEEETDSSVTFDASPARPLSPLEPMYHEWLAGVQPGDYAEEDEALLESHLFVYRKEECSDLADLPQDKWIPAPFRRRHKI